MAASTKHQSLSQSHEHYGYTPLAQSLARTMGLVVRASSPGALIPAIRAEVRAVDPSLPLHEVHTLDQAIDQSLSTRRLTNLLLLGFAAAALLLAAILRALLFEVRPFDPLTFVAAPALLGLVALAACYLPARRATAVDRLEAIRAE